MTFTAQRLASQRFIRPYPLSPHNMSLDMNLANSQFNATSVTSGAANTKGSWVTLDASTAIPASGLILGQRTSNVSGANDRHTLLDLAIGPSGSPTMLIENLQVGLMFATVETPSWFIPLRVPTGVPIIARMQCATASVSVEFNLSIVGDRGGVPSFHECTTYGANTAISNGVYLASSGTNNVKGAWTEITASTTSRVRALSWGHGVAATTVFFNADTLVDVGVGPVGSEVALVENLHFRTATNESVQDRYWRSLLPVAVDVPAGTRLVGRSQSQQSSQQAALILYAWS